MSGKGFFLMLKTRDLTLISSLTAMVFVLEQILSMVPFVQLTVFLLVLFSKKLGFLKTTLIISIHVVLDNAFLSSFDLIFTPIMWMGWMMIPISLHTIFKGVENPWILGLIGGLCALIYCLLFIPPTLFIYHLDFLTYWITDIPFEIGMVISSILTIGLLYSKVSPIFDILKENQIISTNSSI